jgi:threonine dehydrogenase-like Zn-dependent dehydrogenase
MNGGTEASVRRRETASMKAAVFVKPGVLDIVDRPEPTELAPGEVLVEVECCGLCGSDLHAIAVPPGHPTAPNTIMGHEFVGHVVAHGESVDEPALGTRVVVDPDPKCGVCANCQRGMPSACLRLRAIGVYRDGGLAALCRVPARATFAISEDVPAWLAAIAEPLACVVHGVQRSAVQPGESALVFGGGSIGCMFAALLSTAGSYPTVVVEPAETRRAIALRCGADHALSPEEWAAAGREVLPRGADVVVDAVGSLFSAGLEAVATGGRLVLIGMNSNARAEIAQNEITRRGISVLGSYITNFTFPTAIRLLERGEPDLAPIVTHRLSLDEVRDGLELLRTGEALKVVIDLNGTR